MSKEKYAEPEELLDEEDIIDPEEIEFQKKKKLKPIRKRKIKFEEKQEEYNEFSMKKDIEEFTPLEEE
jgi:hypothetical protein